MFSLTAALRGLLAAGLGLTLGCVPLRSYSDVRQVLGPTPSTDSANFREYRTMAQPAEPAPAQNPAPPPRTADTVPTPPVPRDPLRQLQQRAAERYASIDSYIVRLRRREQVNGKDGPEETLLVKFRKEPWSVYFKWVGKVGEGREATYVKGHYEDKIHTLLAAGDMPFTPAGKRIDLAADSLIVRARSRHPITNAGIGALIDRFGEALAWKDKNGNGMLHYRGPQKRPEFEPLVEEVEQTIPANREEALREGGRRFWYFDTASALPVLVITEDTKGHEVEYYCYDRFQFPVKLDDADFDPDKMWSKPEKKP